MNKEENKSVIKTVSIPKWMAEEVQKRSLSLSKILQKGIQEILDTYKEDK